MNPFETPTSPSRPPAAVIAISMSWCLVGCLEFFVWVIERKSPDLIFSIVAVVFTALVLKGIRWVFWVNLGLFALPLGMTIFQLQIPGWAYGTPTMVLWIRFSIAVVVILLHQVPALRLWFGIRGSGKRWQVTFWLLVGALTMLGQYILPTLYSLRG